MEQLLCPISEKAQTTPDHPALITDAAMWTYRDLDGAVHALSHLLYREGIREHQRVAFIAKNVPATLLLFFALFRLRAIACPLSDRLPDELLLNSLKLLEPAHFLKSQLLPQWNRQDAPPLAQISLNSPATFLFTSGSSGTPKIACHSFANHYYNALGALQRLKLTPSSRWLLSLPLFHVSGIGILFRCFQRGATVVLSQKTIPQALPHFQITHLSLVPTQLYRMLQECLDFPSAITCILLGGGPISQDLLKRAAEKNLPIFTTYGLTEASSIVTLSGKPIAFREIKIDAHQEIHIRGKTLFLGYWDPLTQNIHNADNQGWFPTKDIGHFLPTGDLEILGRKDRMFISGGENIHPEEIERALLKIPGIRQASVLPIPDPEFGQRPVAFIDDTTGSHTLESIHAALLTELPSFKKPVRILPYPVAPGFKPDLPLLRTHLKSIA